MTGRPARRATPRPLDRERLEALAIHYVGRYATTRAKLAGYLTRKLRERGWEGGDGEEGGGAPVAAIVERLATLGYVDDAGFAAQRAAALGRRGYGAMRVGQALKAAGVGEADAAPAETMAREGALAAALAFARRRRLGPYAGAAADGDAARRAVAAMLRAGHAPALAWMIVRTPPGGEIEDMQG